MCRSTPPAIETLQHALFDCEANQAAGALLLLVLKQDIPDLTSTKILTLNFELSEEQKFPIVWSIAHFLSSLWHLRVEKKKVELIKIRADMEASCRLLRESRLSETIKILDKIFQAC